MPRVRSRRLGAPAAGGGADGTGPVTALYEDHADHATAGTSKETLDSFSLPANTLAADGERLRITAVFLKDADANVVTVGIDFGGTTVSSRLAAGSDDPVIVSADIWRSGVGAQRCVGLANREGGPAEVFYASTAEDETGAITIAAFGTTATQAGDVSLKSWFIEKIAAPA
ncbi:MAG TPA: hypothetical protein VM487_00365 [Phycisphaerae bacterium]|nr:hypothetical protein [Phycisphaerae bacterium]